jgi:hypothetical protein
MDVAISLGLYLSERNNGIYKDTFITFSSVPEMVTLRGDLKQRYHQLARANWSMNTNIKAVFEEVLAAAVKHKISETQMPTKLLILSDMEFDSCATIVRSSKHDAHYWSSTVPTADSHELTSTMGMIREQYAAAGYKMPQIVFWNLNARPGNVPVKYNEAGAALVSGFSPAIMTSLLGGDDLTPVSIMLRTVMNQRYDV